MNNSCRYTRATRWIHFQTKTATVYRKWLGTESQWRMRRQVHNSRPAAELYPLIIAVSYGYMLILLYMYTNHYICLTGSSTKTLSATRRTHCLLGNHSTMKTTTSTRCAQKTQTPWHGLANEPMWRQDRLRCN